MSPAEFEINRQEKYVCGFTDCPEKCGRITALLLAVLSTNYYNYLKMLLIWNIKHMPYSHRLQAHSNRAARPPSW